MVVPLGGRGGGAGCAGPRSAGVRAAGRALFYVHSGCRSVLRSKCIIPCLQALFLDFMFSTCFWLSWVGKQPARCRPHQLTGCCPCPFYPPCSSPPWSTAAPSTGASPLRGGVSCGQFFRGCSCCNCDPPGWCSRAGWVAAAAFLSRPILPARSRHAHMLRRSCVCMGLHGLHPQVPRVAQ